MLNYINSANMQGKEINRADVAASFQKAVVDALVSRAVRLAELHLILRFVQQYRKRVQIITLASIRHHLYYVQTTQL